MQHFTFNLTSGIARRPSSSSGDVCYVMKPLEDQRLVSEAAFRADWYSDERLPYSANENEVKAVGTSLTIDVGTLRACRSKVLERTADGSQVAYTMVDENGQYNLVEVGFVAGDQVNAWLNGENVPMIDPVFEDDEEDEDLDDDE